MFRFHSNIFSEATRGIASALLSIGLGLILFGSLILALPAIFVTIAAGLFFFAGIACIVYAFKALLFLRRGTRGSGPGRRNVNIHHGGEQEHF